MSGSIVKRPHIGLAIHLDNENLKGVMMNRYDLHEKECPIIDNP